MTRAQENETMIDEATLPTASPSPRASAAAAPEGTAILLIDPRRGALEPMVAALAARGHQALDAVDPGRALEWLARSRADAALVHRSVIEAAGNVVRQLRGLSPGLPIIIFGAGAATALPGLDAGVAVVEDEAAERLCELVACAVAAVRGVDRLRHEHELRSLALVQLCHTLRAPLDVIQGYAELLREAPDAPDAGALLDGLSGAVANAMRLTREHLAVASLDTPGVEVRCEPLEIDALLEDLRRLAARPIEGRRVHLTVRSPMRGTVLHTDAGKLRALLAHLVARAAEATPRGALWLRVCPAGDATRFELLDRGSGAPRGALSPAEAFGDPLADDGGNLALVHRLAASLGARLGTRRGTRGGALFTVEVPAALTVPPAESRQATVH